MEIVRALACRHVSHLSYNNNNNSCSNNNGSQENSKDKYNLTNNFASPFPFLSELPSEVLVNIFSFLKSKELCTVALVCRLWRQLTEEGILWKHLCQTELQVHFIQVDPKYLSPSLHQLGWTSWKNIFRSLCKQDMNAVYYPSSSSSIENANYTPNVDEVERVYGCTHYKRGVKMLAQCCGQFHVCRLCHDAVNRHKIDRYATELMLCMACRTIQPCQQYCQNPFCARRMARYYCNVCKLWDDEPNKPIYHCPHCRLCRVGQGLDIDYWHCPTCDVCLSIAVRHSHKCRVPRCLKMSCPVCVDPELMFFSREPIVLLPCGHGMHASCYEKYIQKEEQCCVCKAPLTTDEANDNNNDNNNDSTDSS
jgi:hypothetical protein